MPRPSQPRPASAPVIEPITASQRTAFAMMSSDEPPTSPAPGPIPTTAPGIGPSSNPWTRPNSAPVSPYAATVPHQAYNPQPDDPIFAPAVPSKASTETSKKAKHSEFVHPEAPHQSRLPLLLITIGVLALVAVLLIWLLG